MKRSKIDFIKIKSCTTRVNKGNHKKKMSRQTQRKYVPNIFLAKGFCWEHIQNASNWITKQECAINEQNCINCFWGVPEAGEDRKWRHLGGAFANVLPTSSAFTCHLPQKLYPFFQEKWKQVCTISAPTAFTTVAKNWKYTGRRVNEWISKPCYIHGMEYYLAGTQMTSQSK